MDGEFRLLGKSFVAVVSCTMKRAREDEAEAPPAEEEHQPAAASKENADDSDTDADEALVRQGGRVKKLEVELRRECPYLATVNRQVRGLLIVCFGQNTFCEGSQTKRVSHINNSASAKLRRASFV